MDLSCHVMCWELFGLKTFFPTSMSILDTRTCIYLNLFLLLEDIHDCLLFLLPSRSLVADPRYSGLHPQQFYLCLRLIALVQVGALNKMFDVYFYTHLFFF